MTAVSAVIPTIVPAPKSAMYAAAPAIDRTVAITSNETAALPAMP